MLRQLLILLVIGPFVCGCGSSSDEVASSTSTVSAEDAVQEIISSTPETLEAANVDGNLATVAKEIVKELDEYEDSMHGPAAKHFEKFHLEVDQLPRLVEAGDQQAIEDQLKKINEIGEKYLEADSE